MRPLFYFLGIKKRYPVLAHCIVSVPLGQSYPHSQFVVLDLVSHFDMSFAKSRKFHIGTVRKERITFFNAQEIEQRAHVEASVF